MESESENRPESRPEELSSASSAFSESASSMATSDLVERYCTVRMKKGLVRPSGDADGPGGLSMARRWPSGRSVSAFFVISTSGGREREIAFRRCPPGTWVVGTSEASDFLAQSLNKLRSVGEGNFFEPNWLSLLRLVTSLKRDGPGPSPPASRPTCFSGTGIGGVLDMSGPAAARGRSFPVSKP